MEVNNKLAILIVITTIVVLTFLVVFITKTIINAEPKEQEIDKNIEKQLDDIIGNYTESTNTKTNENSDEFNE